MWWDAVAEIIISEVQAFQISCSFNRDRAREEVAISIEPLSVWMEKRLVGIVSVRELEERPRSFNFESWPISSGIVPDRLLLLRYR